MGILEIIGPVMIGPSSSHTAGAARLGKLARNLLNERPVTAKFILRGSFAETGPGHGTPEALLGGVLDLDPDNPELINSKEKAAKEKIKFEFAEEIVTAEHPNTATILLYDEQERNIEITGSSIGGGKIRLLRIFEFSVEMDIELPFLAAIYPDRPGVAAAVTHILAEHQANIACMKIYRKARGERALMAVETDDDIPEKAVKAIRLLPGMEWVGFTPLLR